MEGLKINGNLTAYIMNSLNVTNLIDFAFSEDHLNIRPDNNSIVLVGMTKIKMKVI